jgi:hypothetical protein
MSDNIENANVDPNGETAEENANAENAVAENAAVENVAEAPQRVVCHIITRYNTNTALANALRDNGAVYLDVQPKPLVFRVCKYGDGNVVMPSLRIGIADFSASCSQKLFHIINNDAFYISVRGEPKYVLERLDVDAISAVFDKKTYPNTATTKRESHGSDKLLVPPDVLVQAMQRLQEAYGFTLRFNMTSERSGTGFVDIKPSENEDWEFECMYQDIKFPMSFSGTRDNVRSVTIGHYRVASKRDDGFTVDTLTAALLHCFNLSS